MVWSFFGVITVGGRAGLRYVTCLVRWCSGVLPCERVRVFSLLIGHGYFFKGRVPAIMRFRGIFSSQKVLFIDLLKIKSLGS